ncbi:MAG: hypothetical protein ACYDAQ_21860, partial [Mycobacteriales bacterium]
VDRGLMSRAVAYPLGAVFLVAWILLQHWGHWILSPASPTNLHQHAYFPLWIVLCAVAVYGFAAVCWLAGNAEGRHLIQRSWWLITLVFGETALSFYSSFGVTATQPHLLQFPYDTVWSLVIALGIYYWSVSTGFATEEIQAIVATGSGLVPEEA